MNEPNLIVDALHALPKLVNEGIRFIKEGEANRKKFFDIRVKPIKDVCNILYDAHISTLQNILDSVRQGDLNKAARMIENAVLFEQGNTDQLAIAVKNAESVKVKGHLGDLFSNYINYIGKILVPNEKPQSIEIRIHVYTTLERLGDLGLTTPENIINLVGALQNWNRHVLSSFEELRDYCHT